MEEKKTTTPETTKPAEKKTLAVKKTTTPETTKPAEKKTLAVNKTTTPETTKPVEKKNLTVNKTTTPETTKPVEKKTLTVNKTTTKVSTLKKTVAPAKIVTKEAVANKVIVAEPKLAAKMEAQTETKTTSTGSSIVTGFKKVLATGMAAGEIVKNAGSAILASSIESTKTIAGIYKKAGKKALELGQNAIGEIAMVAMKNKQKVVKTGKKAFKETVSTIKEADLISNPLKKEKK